jgi:cytidine deaminase
MSAGNLIREQTKRGDAMALLAIAAIKNIRRARTGDPNKPDRKIAYVLRSLKNPEEIKTLRKVYGRGFIQVSAHSPRHLRRESLARAIARSHRASETKKFLPVAETLIGRDEADRDDDFGQNVRNTFPIADVIVPAHNTDSIVENIQRFVQAFFGHEFHTPTIDELGMYFAKAASYRSADLSRQVGAAIFTDEGEVVSTGCNEVPKAGGGQYWPHNSGEMRDFKLGYDSSARLKRDMLAEIIDRLKDRNWLSTRIRKRDVEELVKEAIEGRSVGDDANPLLAGVQLMDVLEFGRIVHAEMAAVTEAARLGRPLKGTTLYCTTFPCHICARHIVAAGVRRVVYVEPYPKSKAADLYPDSIQVDDQEQSGAGLDAVRFESFAGVAPRRFGELFEMRRRKDRDGEAVTWFETTASPRLEQLFPAYLMIENEVVRKLDKIMKPAGF